MFVYERLKLLTHYQSQLDTFKRFSHANYFLNVMCAHRSMKTLHVKCSLSEMCVFKLNHLTRVLYSISDNFWPLTRCHHSVGNTNLVSLKWHSHLCYKVKRGKKRSSIIIRRRNQDDLFVLDQIGCYTISLRMMLWRKLQSLTIRTAR